MEPEMYHGTIHPDVWYNKMKNICRLNQITENNSILEFCKNNIHPSINVKKVNSLMELINVLKSDISFDIFKNSVKRKLQELKFDPKGDADHILQFTCKFREYCFEAEIDVEEQKKYLLNKLPEGSFQYKFITSNLEKITTLSDLIKMFDDSCFEESKIIKYGSCITLKHVLTGTYLSSCNINYVTGSEQQMTFTRKKFPDSNAIWIISDSVKQKEKDNDPLIYRNGFHLTHKESRKNLYLSKNYKSPETNLLEVSCRAYESDLALWKCIETTNSKNSKDYVYTKDIINFQGYIKDSILRSHDFTFKVNNKLYQEVGAHKERIGGIDEWCIELW
ncbi:hypothetical protein C1645_841429 [Glomus cerebriforme]|uniref:MIR domain-containing protein n=1 Tax=Glomus cerebriforme TaxID=658196 RepID=A0A397RY81_9GLOM|nr:hypothetical protein C1645_841429 [Glomus cerebriforme]